MPNDVCDRARDEDEHPEVRRRVGRRSERAEDDQGDPAAERQLGKVERELRELAQLAPAPVDHQRNERADELPDQQRRGRAQQQAQREPDLRQRERVRLLAELEVDDQHLGEIEGEREPVPREDRLVPERRNVGPAQRDRPHKRAGEREHSVEGPDATRCAKGLAHRRAERAQQPARRAAQVGEGTARDHRPLPLLISPSSRRAIPSLDQLEPLHESPLHELPDQLEPLHELPLQELPDQLEPLHELPPQEMPDQLEPLQELRSTSCLTSWSRSTYRPTSSGRPLRGRPSRPSRRACRRCPPRPGARRRSSRGLSPPRESSSEPTPVDHLRPLWASARGADSVRSLFMSSSPCPFMSPGGKPPGYRVLCMSILLT